MPLLGDERDELSRAKKFVAEPWRVSQGAGGWLFWDDIHHYTIQQFGGQLYCDCETWFHKPRGRASCSHTRTIELMGLANS